MMGLAGIMQKCSLSQYNPSKQNQNKIKGMYVSSSLQFNALRTFFTLLCNSDGLYRNHTEKLKLKQIFVLVCHDGWYLV
jgi:hypothetical protein